MGRADVFRDAAEGVEAALAGARTLPELDGVFSERAKALGFLSAGYLRVFGEGRFHDADYLFGATLPGWAERYQAQGYAARDPVVTATCRMTRSFTLEQVAGPSPEGAPMLAESRTFGLYDGFVAPIRSGYNEVGFVLLSADAPVELGDYRRFLLQGMCEAYARAGLKLVPTTSPEALTRREIECLKWVAVGRSDPQIGMILGLSPNTVHGHVEAAKTKLDANSRAQLVMRAVMAGLIRSDPSRRD